MCVMRVMCGVRVRGCVMRDECNVWMCRCVDLCDVCCAMCDFLLCDARCVTQRVQFVMCDE